MFVPYVSQFYTIYMLILTLKYVIILRGKISDIFVKKILWRSYFFAIIKSFYGEAFNNSKQ